MAGTLNELLLNKAKEKGIDQFVPIFLKIAKGKKFSLEALALMMYTESFMNYDHKLDYKGVLIAGGLFAFHKDVLDDYGLTVQQVIDNGAGFQFQLKATMIGKIGLENCFFCTMADNYLPILRKEIFNSNWHFRLSPNYFPFSHQGCTLFEYLVWLSFLPSITKASLEQDYSKSNFLDGVYGFAEHSAVIKGLVGYADLCDAQKLVIASLPADVNSLLTWQTLFTFVRDVLTRSKHSNYALPSDISVNQNLNMKIGDSNKDIAKLSNPESFVDNGPNSTVKSQKVVNNHLVYMSRRNVKRITLNERSADRSILKQIKFKN